MRVTAYLRVSRDPKAPAKSRTKVVASKRPNHAPLTNSGGDTLPTVAFGIELEVPGLLFDRAEQVIATLTIPESSAVIAAEVRQHDEPSVAGGTR
jgi:hypothetical protein